MMGLILKDILALKKYSRTLLLLSGFYLIWGLAMDNVSMIGGIITLLFSMMVITSFYYDDMAKWDAYALTLPVTRRDIITSKYLLSLLFIVIGSILSLLFMIILTLIRKESITIELFIIMAAMLGIAVFFQSIIIPIIIKLGTEKARMAMIGIFLLPTVIVMGISKLGIPKPSDAILQLLVQYLPWIVGCTILIIFAISYYLSIHFMEQKEI